MVGSNAGTDEGRVVNYGVIGTGMMGVEHIENINAITDAAVVAISDPHEASRQAGSQVAPDATVYVEHAELLSHPGLDAVVIASPNFTHRAVLADVLASGLSVLVEKPLCTTVDDCLEVLALAEASKAKFPNQVVQVGLEYRYMPPVERLVELVGSGVVGQPRMVAIREHRFPFLVKVGDWNRFSVNTGGTLVEKCCHFFDLMNLIIGERPSRVMASGSQDVNHLDEVYDGKTSDILDNAFVIVDYPNGSRAMLDLCMFAEATHNQEELVVVGEKGKVEALIPEGIVRIGNRGEHSIGSVASETIDDDHIAYQGLHHGSSYLEHLDFVTSVRDNTAPKVTLADGLWSVAVGEAAHRSIEEGRPIELSEILPDHSAKGK